LVITVHPTDRRTWKVFYSRHGRPRWYTLGDASAMSLTDARREAAAILLRVYRGEDPQALRKAERGAGTFAELADRYAKYAERKNKSWKQADALVRTFLLPKWGKLQAADIARGDVKGVIASIASPSTANQVLASASAIFSWAIKEDVAGIKVNPCHGVERNPTRSREWILSDSELPRFWAAFDDAGLVRSMALKTILLTGQRPGEVCSMRTEHIDGNWWTLPGDPIAELGWPGTKNARSHRVWLPKPVVEIIAELEPEGFVFASARGTAIEALDASMRSICEKLKVEKATPHDLRRTHGSAITALGFGRDAMNRVQNHVEGGIASVYDRHQYSDENKKIMEAVANKMMAQIEGQPANVIRLR
jgi:integrase